MSFTPACCRPDCIARKPTSLVRAMALFLREWYMHPNGQIPAYEFAFGDVNPPVHAWAAWRVYIKLITYYEPDTHYCHQMLTIPTEDRLKRALHCMLDENEFLAAPDAHFPARRAGGAPHKR